MSPARLIQMLCLLLVSACACAAQTPQATPEPEMFLTRLEAALETTGAVIVKGSTPVGSVTGLRGTASVTSWEIIDARGGGRLYGVSVAIRDNERPDAEELAYLDYEEIDPLVAGLDYILKLENTATKLARFEAQYRTQGELSFYRFNTPNGYGTAVAIGERRGPRLVLRPAGLVEFRDLLESAKAIIDEARRKPQ
jgi:hypothetical protein